MKLTRPPKKPAKPKAKVPVKPKPIKERLGGLTPKMLAFINEYTIDFNGTQAALRAGYSKGGAAQTATQLLSRDDVMVKIRERMDQHGRKTAIDAERVLAETYYIATADVNDLVEFRRRCCRHCYGIDYGHQRTVGEMNADRRRYEKDYRACKDDQQREALGDFDEQGGIGYDARKPPNPDCEHCWGDGVGDAYFKPTADLTPAARALYAGVKQTKDGYQMLTIDKMAALEKLFKHKGLYQVDNQQKVDALGDFLKAVQSRGGKLPIKPQ